MLLPINITSFFKRVQFKVYLVTTVDTDDLVLQHQGISGHSGEYTPMRFQLFIG